MTDADTRSVWAAFETATADLTAARACSVDLLRILQIPVKNDLGQRGESDFTPRCLDLHSTAADSIKRLADKLGQGELATDQTIAGVKQSLDNYYAGCKTRAETRRAQRKNFAKNEEISPLAMQGGICREEF